MKKRFGLLCTSLFLVLALAMIFLPGHITEVNAAAPGSVIVNGKTLSSGQYLVSSDVITTTKPTSGGYFYYSGGTLTIHNVSGMTFDSKTKGIVAEGDLTINISGTSALTGNSAHVIYVTGGKLKFTGSGNLTLKNSSYNVIYTGSDLEFAHTGNMTIDGSGSAAVYCNGVMTVGGNVTVTANNCMGLFATSTITVNSGTVKVSGGSAASYATIRSSQGGFILNDGTVTLEAEGVGIDLQTAFSQRGGNLKITAEKDGIWVNSTSSNVVVYAGTLSVTAVEDGIHAQTFYVYGGNINISSTNTSSDSSYCSVDVTNGIVKADHITAKGSTYSSGSGAKDIVAADLGTYDNVQCWSSIQINGYNIADGMYFQFASKTVSSTKPTSGGYAYYKNNTLTLHNYTGSSSTNGITHNYDLTLILSGSSQVTAKASDSAIEGIYVDGDLTIQGSGSLTLYHGGYAVYATGNLQVNSTTLDCKNSGLYAGGNMVLDNANITVGQMGTQSAKKNVINAHGSLTIKGSNTYILVESTDTVYSNGSYVAARALYGNSINISAGSINLYCSEGIMSATNLTMQGGYVYVLSAGTGVNAKNITISAGTLNASGNTDGIDATKLTVNGGSVIASSRNTANDSSYSAISVASPYSTNFVVADDLAVIGNGGSTSANSSAVNVSNLSTYDYIRIGDFIMMHEVVVPSGYYLESGNSVTTISTTKPTSGKYAYYYNGSLTLDDYTYTGSSVAIRTYADTTISLVGGSEVNHIISHSGDLTFQGSGVLEIDTNLGTDAINSNGNVSINNGRITINSDNGGIYCNDFSLKNAFVWLTANYNGIDFNSKFTVQSGAITIKSTNTSGDASYRAINSRVSGPTININGLNHMVGETSTPDIKSYTGFTSNDYDFVALGECILVRGVVLYKGCYLFNGDSQQYQNVGSHTEYAHLVDKNTLELKGYSYSGSNYGIASNIDLTIVVHDEASIEAKGNYHAIYCGEALTFTDGTNYRDVLTVKSANGRGVYGNNKLTIDGCDINVTSSNYIPVSAGDFILNKSSGLYSTSTYTGTDYSYEPLSADSVTINGGVLNLTAATNKGDALAVTNDLVIKAGTVTISSPKGIGISISDGNMTVQGGVINISSGDDGIYLNRGSYLSIQGGDVTVSAAHDGIYLATGRLNMNGGFLSLGSTDLDNDSSYRALRLRGTSSDYYNVASSLSQSANSAYTTEVMDKLTPSDLSSYDRILIGDFVIVGGRVVKSGYSYTGTDVYSGNKGAGSAYYVNGILTLDQYRNVVSNPRGIQAYSDLTVQVAGESESFITVTSNRYAMAVYGDLTLTGSQKLQLTSATNPVYVEGNMTLAGSDLTLNAIGNAKSLDINGNLNVNSGRLETYNSNETGIYVTGNMTMTGGSVLVSGKKNGIHLPNGKLTVTGGYLQAISTDTTNDNTYAALKLAGTTSSYYNVSESLEQRANKSASTDIDVMTTIDPEELSAYDSVIIGQYISINGKILRSGETMSIGDGSASYVANSEGETLTLSNVDLTVNRSAAISTARSLTLILRGENILECNNSSRTIAIGGDLKIDGTGSLIATNYYNPLYCGGDVELTNATVTLNSKTDYALYLSNGGTLTVNSGNLTASTQSSSKTYPVAKGVDTVVLGLNRGLFGSASSDGSDLKGVTAAELKDCKYMTIGTCAHKDATDDFDHDCDLCGVKNVTSHVYKETVFHQTHHWDICNCGAQIGTASEHTFENGVCSCGMKAPDPVLEVFSESWEAKQGQTLCVNCSATVPGSPTLSYQWYRSASGTLDDLIPISGTNANGTTATLTVDTNTPGTYYVFCEVVTSYGGSAYTNPIKINIIPAEFTTQPAGGEVSHGGSYTVNWATNFTPIRLEVLEYSGEQTTKLIATLSGSATNTVLEASENGYCIRAFYSNTGYVESDQFYVTADNGIFVSGTITSFGSTTDAITVELWKDGATSATYSTTTKGNSAGYSIPNVAPGTYTMKVNKYGHTSYTAIITVGDTDLVHNVTLKLYQFGQTVQIRLIEPWGLKANARVHDGILDNIDYSTLYSYGVYFIRASELDRNGVTAETITIADIIEDSDATHMAKGNGVTIETVDGQDRLTAIYDKGLYTYEFSDSVYVLFYVKPTEGGEPVYAAIRERNLRQLVRQRKDQTSSFSAEERAVYLYMEKLEDDILSYRSDFVNPGVSPEQSAPTLAENPLSGSIASSSKYSFGHKVQVRLIEPWGIRLKARVYTSGMTSSQSIDYSKLQDYGVIVLMDNTTSFDNAEELLSRNDAYVFSASNGDVELEGNMIAANFTKDIYTYLLNSDLHVMFYVKDDDGYHFGQIKVRNLYELMLERKEDTTGSYTEKEKIVYQDMVDLYTAITAYRASLDE